MSPESLIPTAISFFLALLAAWSLLLPCFEQREGAVQGEGESGADREQRAALVLRKETALTELEELEEDHVTSRITEAEYLQSRAAITAEAGEYLRSLGELTDGAAAAAKKKIPLSEDRRKRKRT